MIKYQQTYEYQPAVMHPPQFNPRCYTHFEVRPVSGALGADVTGLDVNRMDAAAFDEFATALADHIVLFVRDQDLGPDALVAFARGLGTPVSYPISEPMPDYREITEFRSESNTVFNFSGPWHTDSMFLERPPKYTILYNIECPNVGGDTSFSNQYLAWDTLAEDLRKLAVNSNVLSYLGVPKDQDPGRSPVKYKPRQSDHWNQEVAHPVARTHPVTGRKALYVSNSYTAHFVGMTQEESLPTLRKLCEHAILPDFTCRFRWRNGTLAIWDNRCCMHYAHNDHAGQVRAMRRVIVEGERPV